MKFAMGLHRASRRSSKTQTIWRMYLIAPIQLSVPGHDGHIQGLYNEVGRRELVRFDSDLLLIFVVSELINGAS